MAKNIVIFHADQLRADCLGCYGNDVARTPHIDGLGARGVRFDNHYATNPVCMPSRASFFTGRYPQAHRVLDNGIALPETELTLAHVLAGAGYETRAVGKLHFTPLCSPAETGFPESHALWQSGALDDWTGPYYGFNNVELLVDDGEYSYRSGGHYGRWVRESFPDIDRLLGPDNAPGPKCPELLCYRSNLPKEAHHSTWVADRAVRFISERAKEAERPFFLFASFVDPHHPFTPPARYAEMFEGAVFPGPYRVDGENDGKPEHYRRAMTERQHADGNAHRPPGLTDDAMRLIQQNYYGMISLIDDGVGRVVGCLEEADLLDNTTFVFTSDHGELLGDHHMLFKGPYPCRSLLRIPLVLRDGDLESGARDAVTSNVDVMPTLLELAGAAIPLGVQGVSLAPHLRGDAPEPREWALESGWSKDGPAFYHHTIYGKDARISYFYNQRDGELYDLAADPHEHHNLFHEPQHRDARDRLLRELLETAARAEPPATAATPTCPW